MKDLFDQLAEDFRPMLREIMQKYVETDGYVGLLFDLGEEKDFIAFAEAIYPPVVEQEIKNDVERYPYRYSPTETFFLNHFRFQDFSKSPYKNHGLCVNDSSPKKITDQFHLYALLKLYKELKSGDNFGFWRLSLQQGKTQDAPGLYLYFFDVKNKMRPKTLEEINKTSFFLTYGIRSVLNDYLLVYHDNPGYVAAIKDLLLCMEGAVTLPSMLLREEKRMELIGKVAERKGEEESELSISHDIDAPVGVLINQEYDRLSDEGKLAVDYLELWRRFAKRAFDDDLPRSISRMFSNTEDLLLGVYRLGHARAMRRGVVPINEESDDAFSAQELLDHSEYWIDTRISLPEEMLHDRSEAWIRCAKTWLLFFMIGSAHHTIAYAFSRLPELESWDEDRTAILRTSLEVDFQTVESGILLKITNRGGLEAPEIPMSNSIVKQLSSSNFEAFPVYDGDRKVEIIHGFRQEPLAVGATSALWTAEIMIT